MCDAGHDRLLEVAAAGRNELEVMGDVLTRADRAAGQPVPWAGELVPAGDGRLRDPVDRSTASSSAATPPMDLARGFAATGPTGRRSGGRGGADGRPGEILPCCADAFEVAWTSFDRSAGERRARGGERGVRRPRLRARPLHGAPDRCERERGPRLAPYDHTPIESGMVFSVEPGVYGGELGTAARCERVVVVREGGPEVLLSVSLGDGGVVADLEARGISKSFGGVRAWTRSTSTVKRDRSTRCSARTARARARSSRSSRAPWCPTTASLTLFGEPLAPGSPRDAARAGVAAVFQELSLVPDLTVAQNIWFRRESLTALRTVRGRALVRETERLFGRLALSAGRPTSRGARAFGGRAPAGRDRQGGGVRAPGAHSRRGDVVARAA